MAFGPITSWQIDGETVKTVTDFIFLGSKITADGDCSHEIKRHFLFGRKVMTNLNGILKSRDITWPTKVHLVKAIIFPVVMYGYESWTIKKAKRQRIDAFELWCWRRLLTVRWTARRSNQSILQEISPEYSLGGLMLKWNSNTLATWWEELTHWKRPWCQERLKVGGEGNDRGWDAWMASPTQWMWIWINSGSWWRTGRPGGLQSTGSQRDATERLNWTDTKWSSQCKNIQNCYIVYEYINVYIHSQSIFKTHTTWYHWPLAAENGCGNGLPRGLWLCNVPRSVGSRQWGCPLKLRASSTGCSKPLHFLPLAGCRGLWSRLSHAPYSQYSWHASDPCCCQRSGFAQVCSRTCVLFTHASQRVGTQGPSSFSSLAIYFIPTQRIRGKKKCHCEKKCWITENNRKYQLIVKPSYVV